MRPTPAVWRRRTRYDDRRSSWPGEPSSVSEPITSFRRTPGDGDASHTPAGRRADSHRFHQTCSKAPRRVDKWKDKRSGCTVRRSRPCPRHRPCPPSHPFPPHRPPPRSHLRPPSHLCPPSRLRPRQRPCPPSRRYLTSRLNCHRQCGRHRLLLQLRSRSSRLWRAKHPRLGRHPALARCPRGIEDPHLSEPPQPGEAHRTDRRSANRPRIAQFLWATGVGTR
jgi:hypothetical protein